MNGGYLDATSTIVTHFETIAVHDGLIPAMGSQEKYLTSLICTNACPLRELT